MLFRSLLGAIAQVTERMLLGTMVTPLSRRRPWVVAKHLVTLDHLSGGRVVLGVGLGEPPDVDFGDFGDEADARVRAAILDEALDVVAGLVGDGRAEVDGSHHRVDATMRPLPVQRPRVPIWVAGVAPNRRPLERALRWDGYVPIGRGLAPDELAAYVGEHRRPGWDLWRDGVVPGDADRPGERIQQVAARTDAVLDRIRPLLRDGDVAVVAHGHLARVLAVRWLGLDASAARLLGHPHPGS